MQRAGWRLAYVPSALASVEVPERWRDLWRQRGLEFGASAVAEMLHATQARNWPARVDLSASVEADLGELTGWSTGASASHSAAISDGGRGPLDARQARLIRSRRGQHTRTP